MNTTPQTPEQPDETTTPPEFHPPHAESARFFQWLRSLGVHRGANRWVGGVCSGLATKWGIDPVIVRGLAVVLTLFFGVGLLAYGIAWALLPEPDGRIHVEEVSRGRWSTGMTGAGILTLLGLAGPGQGFLWGGRGDWFPWSLFWVAGVAAIIYWAVNKNKGKQPSAVPGSTDPANPLAFAAPQAPNHPSPYPTPQPYTVPRAAQQPFIPAPARPMKPVKVTPRLGAAASLLSLGLAVLVGATVLILDAGNVIDLHGYQVATAAAAAGIVAGIAIVVAGAKGRAAGGVGAFAIVTLVLAGLLSLPQPSGQWTSFTNVTWSPTSISAAENGRTLVLGNSILDLTKLDDGAPLTADVKIPIDTAAAKITIKVPTSIPVRINSELAAASLTIDGKNVSAAVMDQASTNVNPNASGYGLIITLQGAAANITVDRVAGP